MNRYFYLHVIKELITVDFITFKQTFIDKYIDIAIWVILTTFVTGYIMPYFGLSDSFGIFQLAGVIASVGLFEVYGNTVNVVADFEGDRIINYHLTLPLPSGLVIVSKCIYFALNFFILSLFILPLGKVVLWNQVDVTAINYPQLLIALSASSIFYGCFVMFAASLIENMAKLGSVWARYIFPMWFMGGFQFSWQSLYKVVPSFAYVSLANPMIYITEAVRAAMLGQAEYLNFWVCIGAILLFAALSLIAAWHKLKKRLDFV